MRVVLHAVARPLMTASATALCAQRRNLGCKFEASRQGERLLGQTCLLPARAPARPFSKVNWLGMQASCLARDWTVNGPNIECFSTLLWTRDNFVHLKSWQTHKACRENRGQCVCAV